MQIRKVSVEDKNYQMGNLSVFPDKKDTKFNLFSVNNNATDYLRQTLTTTGKYIILSDGSKFPESGIVKITPPNSNNLMDSFECIFYGRKIGDQLHMLSRGYNNTSAKTWPVGSIISCPLMAEHHNALKDAIIKIENKIGLSNNPANDSITGILNYLENKWLAPRPIFRTFPRSGAVPLTANFHNFSLGHLGRFLWDFGDGSTSTETHPTHVYTSEGNFTVKLTMITPTGAQGLTQKSNYIEANNEQFPSFFYASPSNGIAKETTFTFLDQTDADIVERHWFFGDGTDTSIVNPNIHTVDHIYNEPGDYIPSLIIRLANNKTKRVFLPEGISVL
jgi:PKD repeat protein